MNITAKWVIEISISFLLQTNGNVHFSTSRTREMIVLCTAAHIRANNQTQRKNEFFDYNQKRWKRENFCGRMSNQIHTASDEHYDAMMIAVDQIDSV